MNKLAISVIIPLYNKEQHIAQTLDSVYQQQDKSYEVIVINDGSTDNSLGIVEGYKQQHKLSNLRIINQKNQGVSAARNNAVLAAKGDFVAFLDADDVWLPLYLTQTIKLINKYPFADIFACRYQYKNSDNCYQDARIKLNRKQQLEGIFEGYFDCASKGDLPFVVSSVTMNRNSFIHFGMFPVNEPMGEDQALFTHVAIHGLIAYSPNIHVIYNLGATNRACVSNIPSDELPFSRRLTQTTKQVLAIKHNQKQNKAILTFCAAHLCHLAKLNIRATQFEQARVILSDKRCWLKPKHKIALYIWSIVAQCQKSIKLCFGS